MPNLTELTVHGNVRIMPSSSPVYAHQLAERLKQVMANPPEHTSPLTPSGLGMIAPILMESTFSLGKPQSWKGELTVQVGKPLVVRIGHLALVDMYNGQIKAIRPFQPHASE